MPSTRIATWLALAAGALGGAAAALLARPASQPVPAEPAASVAPAPAPSAAQAAIADAASEAAARDAAREAPAPSGPVTHYAPPLPPNADAVKHATLRCAWGHIDACLQASVAYREGRGIDVDKSEAKLYMNRARELSVDLCDEGHREACYALAYMYEHGVGLPAAPDKVPALLARVRMLCRIKATPFCRRVPPKTDGG